MSRISSGRRAKVVKYPKLRQLLRIHCISIPDAAEIAGIKASTLSDKIRGDSSFKLEEALKISDYFGMTVEEIFKEDNDD